MLEKIQALASFNANNLRNVLVPLEIATNEKISIV
jgi:hypothetical protein